MNKECIEIVEKINSEIYELQESGSDFDDINPVLVYSTDGDCHLIKFLNVQIWNSEGDERDYINENTPQEDYEDLEGFIRKKIQKLILLIKTLDRKI